VIGKLREMSQADLAMVLQWRNSQEVRDSSFNNGVISLEDHLDWWEKDKINPLSDLMVYEWRGIPVGVVTFKYDSEKPKVALWSFYVGNAVEPGIGTRMCMAAIEYAFFVRQVQELSGEVISFNDKSVDFHKKLGFKEDSVLMNAYERNGKSFNVINFKLKNVLNSDDIQLRMKSAGLNIRPLKLCDIDEEYVSWYQNSDGHLNYFTGSRRSFTRKDILGDFSEGLKSQERFYYLIEAQDGSKIGNVKVGPIDKVNMTSDLVCLIGNRNFAGKGLASKSIDISNQIAFRNHSLRRLQGGMYEDHIASIRAYSKAGWFEEVRMKGFYWVNGKAVDRVCVACLNPRYFEKNDNEQ